ncbi:putative porin [Shewanella sp. GXUN23E]|uniref:putative porin n=1 Tax=Shewanella sp. GXUN23E TaxID=3422498 RepID=UPI003D7D7271
MNRYFLPLLGLPFLSISATAQDTFQHQANITLGTVEWDDNQSDELIALSYDYYLAPISTEGPYALNGFLAQTSSLNASFNKAGGDAKLWTAGGTWVFGNNWFVRGNYSITSDNQADFDVINIGGGWFINDATEASLHYISTDIDADCDCNWGTDTWQAQIRSFVALQATAGVDLSASWRNNRGQFESSAYSYDESVNAFDLQADWYLTRSLALGAEIILFDDSNVDSQYSLSAQYWLPLGNTFSLQASLAHELQFSTWEASVGVTGRF